MKPLHTCIESNEDWLLRRIVRYSRERGYTKYTSTLEEAWRMSVVGLSASLIEATPEESSTLELDPDDTFLDDAATQFGIVEARMHRERGVSLPMFLGLMKYFRQSYKDLLLERRSELERYENYLYIVERFFDRVEVAFCAEWLELSEGAKTEELQAANRAITNEKNKYLTLFESLPTPVFFLDIYDHIEELNHAAAVMLDEPEAPGSWYYHRVNGKRVSRDTRISNKQLDRVLPWLAEEVSRFHVRSGSTHMVEKVIETPNGPRVFHIHFSSMLDISGKFLGTILILNDISDLKRLEQELTVKATTDSLTGLFNRRYFLERTERELRNAHRYGLPFSLIMIDVDHFKRINDSYGHLIGDRVLEQLARETRTAVRATDFIGRLGGEEFAIALANTSLPVASQIAERLRRNVAERTVVTSGQFVKCTVSIGVATTSPEECDLTKLLLRADEALYEAKERGRNRVVAQGAEPGAPAPQLPNVLSTPEA